MWVLYVLSRAYSSLSLLLRFCELQKKCLSAITISLCILRRAQVIPYVNSLGLQAQLYCHVKELSSPLISWYHNGFICLHMTWLSWKTCTGSG